MAPDRTRQIIDTTATIRAALQLRAMKLGVQRRRRMSVSEFLNELLERELAKEIQEVSETPEDAKPRRKRPD